MEEGRKACKRRKLYFLARNFFKIWACFLPIYNCISNILSKYLICLYTKWRELIFTLVVKTIHKVNRFLNRVEMPTCKMSRFLTLVGMPAHVMGRFLPTVEMPAHVMGKFLPAVEMTRPLKLLEEAMAALPP